MSATRLIRCFEEYWGEILDLETGALTSGDELKRQCDTMLKACRLHEVQPGEPVVAALANGSSFYAGLMALLKAGASPVLAHSAASSGELSRLAAQAGARLLVRTGRPEAEPLPEWRPLAAATVREPGWWELPRAAATLRPSLAGVCLHPTSGSTGVSKLAVRPESAAIAEAEHYLETIGDVSAADTLLCLTPLSHAYAFGLCFTVSLLSSAALATMASFKPRLALRALEEGKAGILQAVPAMYDVFLRVWRARRATARHAFSAGAPLPAQTALRFAERTGLRIRSLYGTTETGGISIASGDPEEGVGCAMRGVEAALEPAEGEEPGAGGGELKIRSASMMTGYLEADAVSEAALEDGWFRTGDLATISPRGAIHLRGRRGEYINVSGLKVDPREVEATLSSHPEVAEVKVYRGLHRSAGEAVLAAVVPRGDYRDAVALRTHCLGRLAPHKCPSSVHFLAELPRSGAGKVQPASLPGWSKPSRA